MDMNNHKQGACSPEICSAVAAEEGDAQRSHATPVEGSSSNSLRVVEEIFGYTFSSQSGLIRALTHRSLFSKSGDNDYERLEFLGDAVLDLAVAHLLLEAHPAAQEGELSKMRAALVNTTSLAEIARQINLGTFVRLSRAELANGGAERPSILADVIESMIGAVYRDGGFSAALEVTRRLFGKKIEAVAPRDPKTELQEFLHSVERGAPEYLLECVEGPEHAPTFVTVVRIGGSDMGRGRGSTKKASQQEAAAEALKALRNI